MQLLKSVHRAGRSALAMLGVLLFSGLLVFLGSTPASAHENALTSSQPAASATLAEPPAHITLNFRWRVRPGSTVVTVLGPDGVSQWQRDRPGESGNIVGVDLRELEQAGPYQVLYQGLSQRGHPFRGKMTFVLASRVPLASSRTANTGIPPLWIAGTVLLTASAAAVGIRMGRTGL